MMEELFVDLIALALIAAGAWLIFPPAGLIVAGLGVLGLSAGLKARRKAEQTQERQYAAIEVEER